MTVINAVQIFMLLWSFTAVCQADAAQCNVSCNDVTGTVRNEVIFTCSSEQMTKDCVTLYKFQYPEKYNNSAICREVFPKDPCEKKKTFTCRYTPDTAMKETFSFHVQAVGCTEKKYFTVEISEPVKTDAAGSTDSLQTGGNPEKTTVSAISASVCCIIIIMLTIVIIY